MLLEELVIYSFNNEEILQEYKFNKVGVSIVLGEKDRERIEGDSNGVGKTTFVEIIRCLLGQKFKNKLMKSNEINEKKLFAYMKCTIKGKMVFLGKKLYEQDGYILYANEVKYDLSLWEKYNESDYRKEIEQFLIINNNGVYNLPLGNLNEYLIRDEVEGFIDIYRSRRKAEVSNACLMYLANLPYWFEMDIIILKSEINKLKAKEKYVNLLEDEIADFRLQRKKLIREIDELNLHISTLKITKNLNKHEEKYKKAREEYSILKKKILKKKRQQKQYEKNLESLKKNKEDVEKLLELKDFYETILKYFPDNLVKSYDEVVRFYSFMENNRGKSYISDMKELEKEIAYLEKKTEPLKNIIDNYSHIINSKSFQDDYNNLIIEINEKYKVLSEVEYKINVYNSKKEITESINQYKSDILTKNSTLEKKFKTYSEIIKKIVDDFEDMVKVSYNEQGELSLEYNNSVDGRTNTGRIIINSKIPDEESHGIKTMKIIIFDLACLLSRLRENNEIQFLIHDGAMTVPDNKKAKFSVIEYIDNKLNSMNKGQYIITCNISDFTEEQISEFYKRKYVIKSLDKRVDSKRSLGIKFSTK